jgi:acyl-[acyl-carrier-protein]-phospholipid O-acyltransferase/long-chain-fatty-acid--[acyl-carrier-protein] ligase
VTSGTYGDTLRIPGLQSFLWTQFLGAFNDNVYKIIVTFYAMSVLGPERGIPLAAAIFVLPFLLFSGWSGHLADACSKRSVLIWTKCLEIVAMVAAVPALMLVDTNPARAVALQLGVLFLMATQSTFFSPAKYGILPEVVPTTELSRANGLLEMSTFAAIILGTSLGGELFERWNDEPWMLGLVLVAIAVGGTVLSFGIPPARAARPGQPFAWNPFAEIARGLARVAPDGVLWITIVGISYFWLLGTLFQQLLLPWGQETFGVGEAAATRLYTFLAIGIGAGSLLAGRLSGDKVELGLVPIGSIGLGVFSLLLLAAAPRYALAAVVLVLLGIAGGFFAVPLNALLQQRPAEYEKGRVLATNNVLNTIAMLVAAAAFWVLGDLAGYSTGRIILLSGVFTLAGTVYVVLRVPDFFVRFTLWLLTHTIYRITIVGRPNVPLRGPALIVANHVSVVDGALVGATVQRFVRFIVYGPYFRLPVINWLMRRLHAIPVTAGSRREVVAAIERARAELAAGHVVCIFAEGAISRTGNLLPFQRGVERIAKGLDVPIVPVYLDRVWGSVFSFKREKFFWKLPERLPYPVTVAWGKALPPTATASDVRQAITELGSLAMSIRRDADARLHVEFMRSARKRWRHLAIADSTGQKLTYGRALIGAFAFSRVLERRTPGEPMVGTLLPATAGAVLANIGLYLAGRVPVNLNFTIGREALDAAIRQANIKTILTSRRFLEKANLPELPGMLFLEELRQEITGADKLRALINARLVPMPLLARRYGPARDAKPGLATIIFSSGSTGVPKGVMLTHANVLANVDALSQIFPMSPADVFIGVLPLFHSFGFTGTMWFPLLQGAGVAYHPNPMDAKTIGELAETYKATMLISTPTFCSSYVRRCTKEQFAHLKYAIVGAEKLREPLRTEFREKFGIELFEGYGCTEMAPVVAVNRPNVRHGDAEQVGNKPGSVGHPIPGVAARIVDQDTGADLGTDKEGLLLVKGPNMMAGYLDAPDRTAEVIRDGWYVTGDIARIDDDGFIFITDRLSRFSKIGGEMVPHVRIEDAINAILGEAASVVTAVPDASKGERLVAFYARADVAPDTLWERLCQTDLPRLWIPKRESVLQIDAIPTLGTGKVDLRSVKQLALDRASVEAR